MTRRLIIVGIKGGEQRNKIKGGEGQARAEAQVLLDYAGHWPT